MEELERKKIISFISEYYDLRYDKQEKNIKNRSNNYSKTK